MQLEGKEYQSMSSEMKKDIGHLSEKINSIANVRAWIIAFGATIAAITGIANLIKLFI